MIVILALLLGAATGWWRAARLGGNRPDRLQYAAVHGLVFLVIGVFATVLMGRLG